MTEQVIRGYLILGCMDYIDSFDAQRRDQAYASLSSDVSRSRDAYDKMAWYPLKTISEYYGAIGRVYPNDEKKAYQALLECGRFIAESATNSFLKLLMRIMTPAVFGRKAPDIWARDHRYGRMEADSSQLSKNHLIIHLRDVAGYHHAGPVAAGFGTFALKAVGGKEIDVKVSDWSLTTPDPAQVRIDLRWK
jgi:hypothetical protein